MAKNRTTISNAFQLSLFEMDMFETTTVTQDEIDIQDEIVIEDIPEPEKEFVFEYGIKENIWEQYPWLREHQAEDCAKIEHRFYIEGHKGIQITNGTGVGKTFLGLAAANRAYSVGKKNILIVTPTDKKVNDWCNDNNKKFTSIARPILDTSTIPMENEEVSGIIVTTYANFYQNDNLNKITWDLIIYDESHRLMENGQKKDTVYMQKHREIAGLPNHYKATYVRDNMEYFKSLSIEKRKAYMKEYTDRTKVIFLSASPFAYHCCLIIGDGTLWNIQQNYDVETDADLYNSEYSSYGTPGRYEQFFMENLGYRMRYNKLTIPESGVDVPLLERRFFDNQVKLGAITGRQIEVKHDYSREFIVLNSEIGEKIDEGLSILESREFKDEYKTLGRTTDKWITWLYKNQLLEAIKTKLIIPRIKKHLELGRKVVVFHDYNEPFLYHPFQFDPDVMVERSKVYEINYHSLLSDITKFEREYPHLYHMEVAKDLANVEDEFTKHFGKQVVFFNGRIPKKKRSKHKDDFQSDLSGINIIVVQRQAGKEGIDLHDTTGNYQRVLVDLGLPRRPTDSIQCEGRTYRDGLKSNTVWEYAIINTIFERSTFATQISERASTAENFAMGSKARNLKLAFKQGYEDAEDREPSLEQGFGGKEKDHKANDMSEFDISIALYYSNIKKTAKNKSMEGVDYFATPEPLGFKMVQWADIRPDQNVLEPSAGHGAIARFFTGFSTNKVIEPSRELMSKLKLNCDNVKTENYIDGTFENFDSGNKFHAILMNPPFGKAGVTAVQHLEKALVSHSYHYLNHHNTRIIAIVPDTPNVDKFVDRINREEYYTDKTSKYNQHYRLNVVEKIKLSATIYLPSCTFNRAGTSVLCKILIFDTINQFNMHAIYEEHDFRHINKIEDFFKEIENLHIPTYIPSDEQAY